MKLNISHIQHISVNTTWYLHQNIGERRCMENSEKTWEEYSEKQQKRKDD